MLKRKEENYTIFSTTNHNCHFRFGNWVKIWLYFKFWRLYTFKLVEHLHSKFVKSANVIQKFNFYLQKMPMGNKNDDFYVDLKACEIVLPPTDLLFYRFVVLYHGPNNKIAPRGWFYVFQNCTQNFMFKWFLKFSWKFVPFPSFLCISLRAYSACLSICLSACLPIYLSAICLPALYHPVCLSAQFHICLCVYLPICISVCLHVWLSAYLPVCLSAFCLLVCLSACLPIWLSCMPVCIFARPPIFLSAHLLVCLSVYLPICLSACLHAYLHICMSGCLSACVPICTLHVLILKTSKRIICFQA